MELRQLKTFRMVAEQLSFTKASQKLYMAQSSVSSQIKLLEQELELKLFDRIGRRVLLTDAGRKLYDYARRMEEMTLEIQSEFSKEEYSRGALTVRVPETLASVYMPEVIRRFHKEHPKVTLDMINCSDEQLREELNSGRIDLAFLLTDSIHFKEVNVKLLKTESLVFVSGPGHALAKQEKISIRDLKGYTAMLPKTD